MLRIPRKALVGGQAFRIPVANKTGVCPTCSANADAVFLATGVLPRLAARLVIEKKILFWSYSFTIGHNRSAARQSGMYPFSSHTPIARFALRSASAFQTTTAQSRHKAIC